MDATMKEELSKQCVICMVNPHKYRCPKCGTKTCSLECVKQHKQRSQCDGIVDTATFVARSEFHDDECLVQRDYNFLSGLDRTIHVQKEDVRQKNKRILNNRNHHHAQHNKRQQLLPVNGEDPQPITIIRRGVHVRQLPRGMQRSVINKSAWDKKLNTFVWSIEYILLDPKTGAELQRQTRFRVSEETKVKDSIPHKMLQQIRSEFNGQEDTPPDAFLFLKLIDRPASSPEFIPLDGEKMIAEVLRDQTVIEFPTLIVSSKEEVEGYKVYEPKSDSEDEDESSSDSDSDSDTDSSTDDGEGSDDDSGDDIPQEETSKPVQEVERATDPGPSDNNADITTKSQDFKVTQSP